MLLAFKDLISFGSQEKCRRRIKSVENYALNYEHLKTNIRKKKNALSLNHCDLNYSNVKGIKLNECCFASRRLQHLHFQMKSRKKHENPFARETKFI